MSVFKRLFQIVKANIHSVRERKQDSVQLADELIQNLEEDIAKVTAAAASQLALENKFDNEMTGLIETIEKRTMQAKTAIQQGNETLARQALIDKKRYVEKKEAIQPHYDTIKKNADMFRAQLRELQEKLEEIRLKRSSLIAQEEAARATRDLNHTLHQQGNDTIQRLDDKLQQLHVEAETARELAQEQKSLDEALDELLHKNEYDDIDAELDMLKKELE